MRESLQRWRGPWRFNDSSIERSTREARRKHSSVRTETCARKVSRIATVLAVTALLKEASSRSQLIVTTHSKTVVDALSESPEDIVVCQKIDGQTSMKRLDGDELKVWLEKYSLGELWRAGDLGGNRW